MNYTFTVVRAAKKYTAKETIYLNAKFVVEKYALNDQRMMNVLIIVNQSKQYKIEFLCGGFMNRKCIECLYRGYSCPNGDPACDADSNWYKFKSSTESLEREMAVLKEKLSMATNLIESVIYSTYDFSTMIDGASETRWLEDAKNFLNRTK